MVDFPRIAANSIWAFPISYILVPVVCTSGTRRSRSPGLLPSRLCTVYLFQPVPCGLHGGWWYPRIGLLVLVWDCSSVLVPPSGDNLAFQRCLPDISPLLRHLDCDTSCYSPWLDLAISFMDLHFYSAVSSIVGLDSELLVWGLLYSYCFGTRDSVTFNAVFFTRLTTVLLTATLEQPALSPEILAEFIALGVSSLPSQ